MFNCLLKHRFLRYKPHKEGLIINAGVILHNMCIENNVPLANDEDLLDPNYGIYNIEYHDDDKNDDQRMNRVNPDLVAGRQLKRNIIYNHFL